MEISVTNLLNNFKPDFDKKFFSETLAMKALIGKDASNLEAKKLQKSSFNIDYFLKKYKITETDFLDKVDEVINGWDAKREEGSKIHDILENNLSTAVKYISDGENYKESEIERGKELDVDSENVMYYPEFKIDCFYKDLKIKGRIDLLKKDGNSLTIVDYKTGKLSQTSAYNTITKKKSMLKYPLSNIQHCSYWHAIIQLSIYAWMIKQNYPQYENITLIICHIEKGKSKNIEVDFLEDKVLEMIKFYLKEEDIRRDKEAIMEFNPFDLDKWK